MEENIHDQYNGSNKFSNNGHYDDLERLFLDDNQYSNQSNHQKHLLDSITKSDEEEWDELFKSMYVSPDFVPDEKAAIIKIKSEYDYSNAFTLGNISTIVGKPKSRKTMFVSLLIASLIKNNPNNNTFCTSYPEKKKILVFDTEQSKAFAWLTYSRIKRLANLNELPDIIIFSLREFDPKERLNRIERAIDEFNDVSLVIIDGIRDLISDVNNAADSTMLTSKLMKWSVVKNLHIMNVIHQNKVDHNARGHLGTELINKSESVIAVDKKDEIRSIVRPIFMRDMNFMPFAFGVDEYGIPYLDNNWQSTALKKERKLISPQSIDLEEHTEVLNEVFKDGEVIGYEHLRDLIKTEWAKKGTVMGNAKALDFMNFYLNSDLVSKLGVAKPSRYVLA